jgi:hypothetical protein
MQIYSYALIDKLYPIADNNMTSPITEFLICMFNTHTHTYINYTHITYIVLHAYIYILHYITRNADGEFMKFRPKLWQ